MAFFQKTQREIARRSLLPTPRKIRFVVGATELFNSISHAKPVWEASAIICSLYISSALGVVLACQTSFLHSEHPPSSTPLNTEDGLSSDADNQGTCLRHKAAEGKKCNTGSAASWAARSSTVKDCHRMSLFMRKVVSADFNGSFHRSKLKTQWSCLLFLAHLRHVLRGK